MTEFRKLSVNKLRDAWVEVNLDNIEHNICEIKKCIKPDVKIMAVVKADAYGHGSIMLSETLKACGVSAFGVSSIDEGFELRRAKVEGEILTLGAVPIWGLENAYDNDISVSIFNDEHLLAIRNLFEKTSKKLKVHIKIDTGMNRIGVCYKNAKEFVQKVQTSNFVDLKGIFTHFACAEDEEKTMVQFERFKNIIDSVNTENLTIHCANSASILSYPAMHLDMVRAGIIIHGLLPDLPLCAKKGLTFKQAIGVKGRITNIHKIEENEGVSYSHTFCSKGPTRIATIPIGYADGVDRNLSNKMKACLNGHLIDQVGNISMDQMMFDIKDIEANEGDIITILGENDEGPPLLVDTWAKTLNTINYELTCRLKVRLPRIFTR